MIIFNKNVNPKDLEISLGRKLDNFEFYYKGDFVITSGLRSVEHNKKIGGSPTSSHLKGLACDIACSNSTERLLIIKTALDAGFVRIGVAKDHIHLDVDPDKAQYCTWLE